MALEAGGRECWRSLLFLGTDGYVSTVGMVLFVIYGVNLTTAAVIVNSNSVSEGMVDMVVVWLCWSNVWVVMVATSIVSCG